MGGVEKGKTEMAKRRKFRREKMGIQDRYDHEVILRLELLKGWAGEGRSVLISVSEFTKSMYSK